MKSLAKLSALLFILVIIACSKNDSVNSDNYSSLQDFYSKNGQPLQTFIVDAVAGGTFTTPQGTIITIPANAFKTIAGGSVTGNVTISFKDIYKKSDMLYSGISTAMDSMPLKSAGEFFIKATQNNSELVIDSNKSITVVQPPQDGTVDLGMRAFVAAPETLNVAMNWIQNNNGNLTIDSALSEYMFSLYQFSDPYDSGTWCNSDNPFFFSSYPQTSLTLHNLNASSFADVFLLFTGIDCMIHVYESGNADHIYSFAPQGLECTVVAVSVSNGKVYSSFQPITIEQNQVVDFTLTETTTEQFKSQLDALN